MITHTYLENMIRSVEENGPYMVLADYFALMHAKPGLGVNEQSMSLLVVKDAVDMKGKPIHIFGFSCQKPRKPSGEIKRYHGNIYGQ